MLVHICCSVDSHYFLSELKKLYPDENFIGFFYNPNIHPKAEHDLRYNDVKRSCQMLEIPLILAEYDVDHWLCGVRGMEEEPEKGHRCVKCFDIRLIRSATEAKKIGEKSFTSTLLSSPMKEQKILFAEGDEIAKTYDLDFIKVDVRSKGGVQRQNALAKQDNLYRQNYCGCQFALKKQRDKQEKISLEMMSSVRQEKQVGSIQERLETFKMRDHLESQNKPYLLTQRRMLIYRLLRARIMDFREEALDSHFLAHSHAKKLTKINKIIWAKPQLDLSTPLSQAYAQSRFEIGYSQQDSLMLVPLGLLNLLLEKNISHLKGSFLSLDEELELRRILSGNQSRNPIVILEDSVILCLQEQSAKSSAQGYFEITYEIESIFQEENVFQVLPLVQNYAKN